MQVLQQLKLCFQNVREKILKWRAHKSGKGRLGTKTTWGNNWCWIVDGSHVPQHTVFKFRKSLQLNLISWRNTQIQKSINRLKGPSRLTHTTQRKVGIFCFTGSFETRLRLVSFQRYISWARSFMICKQIEGQNF